MIWYLPSVSVSDRARIELFETINVDAALKIPFRAWSYFKNPNVPTTTDFTWTITSLSNIERPRYVIVAFQTNKINSYAAHSDYFDNIKVINLRVHLNSENFPYVPMNLNYAHGNYVQAYQMFIDFQRSFYGRVNPTPCVDFKDFADNHAIYVIDCSMQNESVKITTVDIRLDVQTSEAIAANTACHCLVIHDRTVEYTPLSNVVRKI